MRWLSWRDTVDSQYPFDPARLDMQHILVPRSQSAWQVGAGKVKGRAYMVRLGKTRQHAGCPFEDHVQDRDNDFQCFPVHVHPT